MGYHLFELVFSPSHSSHTFESESFEMDGIGIFSVDMYCQFPQKLYHQNSYIGVKDCNKKNSTMVMEETVQSSKCVGSVDGKSIQFECIEGPCPTSSSFDKEEAHVVLSDVYRTVFASTAAPGIIEQKQA